MMNNVRFEGYFEINGIRQQMPFTLSAEVPLFDEYIGRLERGYADKLADRDRRIAELKFEVSQLQRKQRRWWKRARRGHGDDGAAHRAS